MGLELSFKGSGEDYVSRIHRGIRWTRIVISRGQKLTTTIAHIFYPPQRSMMHPCPDFLGSIVSV